MTFSPIVLILEDEPMSLDLLHRAFAEELDERNVLRARTVNEAEEILRKHTVHGVSIDQNVPRSVAGAVTEEHTLRFIQENRWPLAKRVVYTAKGSTHYANLVGQAGADYREKARRTSQNPNHRTLFEYTSEFVQDLRQSYVERALSVAGTRLPHSLATPASNAAAGKVAHDWPAFFKNFNELRERLLRWTLGVTFAGQCRTAAHTGGRSVGKNEDALKTAWSPVPLALRRYTTTPGRETGSETLRALDALRRLRNKVEHFERRDYVEDDFTEHYGSIVAVIDLLAFFCETPIMHSPRFHPTRRPALLFKQMGPSKTEISATLEGDFDPPAHDERALYLPWQEENGPVLICLRPWFQAHRLQNRELEFRLHLVNGMPEPL
jgi:hypothetical protein